MARKFLNELKKGDLILDSKEEIDDYGLENLIPILQKTARIDDMISVLGKRDWYRKKLSIDSTGLSLTNDVEVTIEEARKSDFERLDDFAFLCMVRSYMPSQASQYPIELLVLKAMLGEIHQTERTIALIILPIEKIKAYCKVAEVLFRIGKHRESKRFLNAANIEYGNLQEGATKERSIPYLVSEYGRHGFYQRALDLLQGLSNQRLAQIYAGDAIKAIVDSGNYKEAIKLASFVQDKDVLIISLAHIYLSIEKSEEMIREELLQNIKNASSKFDSRKVNVEHTTMVCVSLFKIGLDSTAKGIGYTYLDNRWWIKCLRFLAREGFPEKAFAEFEKMEKSSKEEAELTDIAQIFAMVGKTQQAFEIVQKIEIPEAQDGTWGALVWQISELGNDDSAYSLIQYISSDNIGAWALAGSGQANFFQGNLKKAKRRLQESENLIGETQIAEESSFFPYFIVSIKDGTELNGFAEITTEERDSSLVEIVGDLVSIGRIKEGLSLTMWIRNEGKRDFAYLSLIALALSNGLMKKAEAMAGNLTSSTSDAGIRQIITSYISMGKTEDTKRLLTMLNSNKAQDEVRKNIVNQYANSGDFYAAYDEIDEIGSDHIRNEAIIELALAKGKSGDLDGCVKILESLDESEQLLRAFSSVCGIATRQNNEEIAKLFLAKLEGTFQENKAIMNMIRAQIHNKNYQKARQTLAQIPNEDKNDIFVGLVRSLISSGERGLAKETINRFAIADAINSKMFWIIDLLEQNKYEWAKELINIYYKGQHAPQRMLVNWLVKKGRLSEGLKMLTDDIDHTAHDPILYELITILSENQSYWEALLLIDRIQGGHYRSLARQSMQQIVLKENFNDKAFLISFCKGLLASASQRGANEFSKGLFDIELLIARLLNPKEIRNLVTKLTSTVGLVSGNP